MRRDLVEMLCCPRDQAAPLELLELESRGEEVVEGVLRCRQCGRWYAIMNGVAHLVRDGLRLVEDELEFLERHRAALPPEAAQWIPYGLDADL